MLETALWEPGVLDGFKSGSSITWLGDWNRLVPLSVKCREGVKVLDDFSGPAQC